MLDDIQDSFNAKVRDSFNVSTTNTANLSAGVTNVGNTDSSTNGSDNTDIGVTGSFTEDSHDQTVDAEFEAEDSFNTITDASTNDSSDNSIDDSYNELTEAWVSDSHNSLSVSVTDDHSTNVGVREYNTGFGDLSVGAGTGGMGGDLTLDNRATIVDQSVNQNIDAFAVAQFNSSDAVVASGDGAMAAGDDLTVTQSLDESTTISAAEGDVNIGNSTTVDLTLGSGNVYEDSSTTSVSVEEWDVDDSFNDESVSLSATNSFNDELSITNETDWDVDANVIWESDLAGIADDIDIDLPMPPA